MLPVKSHSWMAPSLNPSALITSTRTEREVRDRFWAVRVWYPGKVDWPSGIRLSNVVTPVPEMSRVFGVVRPFRAVRSLMPLLLLRFRFFSVVRPLRPDKSVRTVLPLRFSVSSFVRLLRPVRLVRAVPLRFSSVTPVKRYSSVRSSLSMPWPDRSSSSMPL